MNMEDTLRKLGLTDDADRLREMNAEAEANNVKIKDTFVKGRIVHHKRRGGRITIIASHGDGTCSAIDNKTGEKLRVKKENLILLGDR